MMSHTHSLSKRPHKQLFIVLPNISIWKSPLQELRSFCLSVIILCRNLFYVTEDCVLILRSELTKGQLVCIEKVVCGYCAVGRNGCAFVALFALDGDEIIVNITFVFTLALGTATENFALVV